MTRNRGFTLTELIASMLITSIVVFALGMMLVDFNRVAVRGSRSRELWADFRFAKDFLARELIKATDFDIGVPFSSPLADGSVLRIIDSEGEEVEISLDPSTNRLELVSASRRVLVLNDVEEVRFFLGDDLFGQPLDTYMNIFTRQERVAIHSGDSASDVMAVRSSTFGVHMRSLN